MKILVTGGAGYIGSHTCVQLLEADYEVVVVDNLSNSHPEALRRVEEITGKSLTFHQVDLLDIEALDGVVSAEKPHACIHFAGYKAVGESVSTPIEYYHNNITGTLNLCTVLAAHDCRNMVFSSSATVYGTLDTMPLKEDMPLSATNPYGQTKLMLEQILRDVHIGDPEWNIVLLRYFNPIGAHHSGRIGEDPNGIPNNLVPYVSQVAVGKLEQVRVFGSDYNTPDGTGMRDYIHVVDLANGHLRAIRKISEKLGVLTYNLGTGRGYSVLEVISAFEKAAGKSIPYQLADRRPGDVATSYADATLAGEELHWQAENDLNDMVADSWRWQSQNPNGYEG